METMYDVRKWLIRSGIVIYTKDRQMDLELMEEEIREAHKLGMMDQETFRKALFIIQREKRDERKN